MTQPTLQIFSIGLLLLGGVAGPAGAQPADSNLSERHSPISVETTSQTKQGNPLWEIPMTNLSATRNRPVFSPTRRPPPSPVPVATPYVPPQPPAKLASPQLTLLGTVLGAMCEAGSANTADCIGIFLDQTNHTVVRLRTGSHHNGWLLSTVQGREATFQNDRDTVILTLPARRTEQPSVANVDTTASATQAAADPPGKSTAKFQLDNYH